MISLQEQLLFLYSTPFYFIIIITEILLSNFRWKTKSYTLADTTSNVLLMALNSLVDLTFKLFSLWILNIIFIHTPFRHWHFTSLYWICLLLAEDFAYYWLHRFDHEIRFFWAVHVTHHSSQHFNFTTGFRSSVFEPVYRFVYFIPLAWIGFKPLDIIFMYSLTQIWGTLVHTKMIGKLGWLELLFVTPSHHRVHHGSNPKYLDKNMGMFLIIWDKLFGTFQPEINEKLYQPIKYGLTKNLESNHILNVVFHEWIQIYKDIRLPGLTIKQRLNYIFGPPGYSHDGGRMTSVQMRELEIQQKSTILDSGSGLDSDNLKPLNGNGNAETILIEY